MSEALKAAYLFKHSTFARHNFPREQVAWKKRKKVKPPLDVNVLPARKMQAWLVDLQQLFEILHFQITKA